MRLKRIRDQVHYQIKTKAPKEALATMSPKRQRVVAWAEKIMIAVGVSGQTLFYFQAYKIYTVGSANDVSTLGFSFATLSLLCWFIYGLIIKNNVLVIVNAFALIGALLTLLAIFRVS